MLEYFNDAVIEYDEGGYIIRVNEALNRGDLKRMLAKLIEMGFRLVDATDDYLTFNHDNEFIIIAYRVMGDGVLMMSIRYLVKGG